MRRWPGPGAFGCTQCLATRTPSGLPRGWARSASCELPGPDQPGRLAGLRLPRRAARRARAGPGVRRRRRPLVRHQPGGRGRRPVADRRLRGAGRPASRNHVGRGRRADRNARPAARGSMPGRRTGTARGDHGAQAWCPGRRAPAGRDRHHQAEPRMNPRLVVLALGSNLGDRLANLQAGIDGLAATPGITPTAVSAVFETSPVGGPDQPDYLNAVLLASSDLPAAEILSRCQSAEQARGRERRVRWGPRTLDIDIIACGDEISDDPQLTLPHPRAHERAFVLVPWHDADPDASLPGFGPVTGLVARLGTIAGRAGTKADTVRRRSALRLTVRPQTIANLGGGGSQRQPTKPWSLLAIAAACGGLRGIVCNF